MIQEELINILAPYGQEHLVKFWDDLSENEQIVLCDEIKSTDFAELERFFQKVRQGMSQESQEVDSAMKPVPVESKGSFSNSTKDQLKNYEGNGLKAIAEGKVAVLLLAGGQGTRLGVSYPKGMYSVNLPSKKTLFQLQAERLIRIQEIASAKVSGPVSKAVVPWYIMTSENTKGMITEYFEKNNYFNLEKENVSFFEQGTLPCLTKDGKILLDQKSKISRAPDGNGGLYKALVRCNVLEDMAKRGIEYIHIYCVDNILIRIADPTFIGFCIEKQADCAAKVVKKVEPEENVGVICQVNDHFQVVEYSEISEVTRNLRDESGDLVFNAGNICNHFLTCSFLNEVCKYHETNLQYHIAEKKINYVDENGLIRKPVSKNGIKLEKFIFDIFQFSHNFAIWEVLRKDEFSPLKNGLDDVTDNPVTCRKHIMEQHFRWAQNAGLKLDKSEDDCSTDLEISPLISYSGEGLEFLADQELIVPLVLELDKTSKTVLYNGLDLQSYAMKNNHKMNTNEM